jgi:hypothetical protein
MICHLMCPGACSLVDPEPEAAENRLCGNQAGQAQQS